MNFIRFTLFTGLSIDDIKKQQHADMVKEREKKFENYRENRGSREHHGTDLALAFNDKIENNIKNSLQQNDLKTNSKTDIIEVNATDNKSIPDENNLKIVENIENNVEITKTQENPINSISANENSNVENSTSSS